MLRSNNVHVSCNVFESMKFNNEESQCYKKHVVNSIIPRNLMFGDYDDLSHSSLCRFYHHFLIWERLGFLPCVAWSHWKYIRYKILDRYQKYVNQVFNHLPYLVCLWISCIKTRCFNKVVIKIIYWFSLKSLFNLMYFIFFKPDYGRLVICLFFYLLFSILCFSWQINFKYVYCLESIWKMY